MAEHDSNPMSHVVDHPTLELPGFAEEIHLPYIGWPRFGFQVTRFMIMEVVAAVLVILIIVPLARHVAKNRITRGRWMNIFEVMVMFIRDKVARASIDGEDNDVHHDEHGHAVGHGHHDLHAPHRRASDQFLPFLLTLFFFILFNNLLG